MELVCFLLLTGLVGWTPGEACDDVDTAACIMLENSRTDLCKDVHIANNVCKRHCKLCPLQCFHCDTPTNDPTSCLTNTTCNVGEACSVREVLARDGRHEYTFGCLSTDVCDGKGLITSFGRRDVHRRNVAVACCFTDYCNDGSITMTTPMVTTTTAPTPSTAKPCYKKIQFMVQVGSSVGSAHLNSIKQFLTSFVNTLDIGVGKNEVGIASYDTSFHNFINMAGDQTRSDVLASIKQLHSHHGGSDVGQVLHELSNDFIRYLTTTPDVFVIISDGTNGVRTHTGFFVGSHTSHHSISLSFLHHHGVKVISMDIGKHLSDLDSLADHVIHLHDFQESTFNAALPKLSSAICS